MAGMWAIHYVVGYTISSCLRIQSCLSPHPGSQREVLNALTHVKMPQIPAPGSHPNEKHIPTPNSPHPKACGLRPVRLSGPPLSHARAQPLEEVHGPLLSGVQPAFARVVHSDLDVW